MNIYKLSVKVPNKNRYDVYDSAIVIAKDEEEARSIHPASNEDLYWDEVYDLETDSMKTHKNIYHERRKAPIFRYGDIRRKKELT